MGIESRVDSKMHAAGLGPRARAPYNGGMTPVLLFNNLRGRGRIGKKCPLPNARLQRRTYALRPAASGQVLQRPDRYSIRMGGCRSRMRSAIHCHQAMRTSSVPQRGRNAIRIRRYDGVIASGVPVRLSGIA